MLTKTQKEVFAIGVLLIITGLGCCAAADPETDIHIGSKEDKPIINPVEKNTAPNIEKITTNYGFIRRAYFSAIKSAKLIWSKIW